MTQPEREISKQEMEQAKRGVLRRTSGEPLAYIFNSAHFLELEFYVDSHVLIPRQDSEAMVLQARQQLHERSSDKPRVLDLGAGSGALGLATIKPFVQSELLGLDVSDEAIRVARTNAHSLQLTKRAEFQTLDLDKEDLPEGEFDLILANPPYIDRADPDLDKSVAEYEPPLALYAGDQGLEKIKIWTKKALKRLKTRGIYLCEIGFKQADQIKQWHKASLDKTFDLDVFKDLSGRDRYIRIKKRGE